MDRHAREVWAHAIDRQRTGIPIRSVAQSHVFAYIHVTWDPMRRDANGLEGSEGLRAPRSARLTIAGERFYRKDASHIRRAATFTARKLGDTIQPAAICQVLRRDRMDRVQVRMITDVMALQGGNHIAAASLLQHARLFSDDFEGGMNATGGKQLAEAQGRIIIRRREVVLGIEEQQDVNLLWRRFGVDGRRHGSENEISEQPNESVGRNEAPRHPGKIRNPKPEIRRKAEIRNPNQPFIIHHSYFLVGCPLNTLHTLKGIRLFHPCKSVQSVSSFSVISRV